MRENEDLLVKLLRVIANLSINSQIGSTLVSDKRVGTVLVKLLRVKSVEAAEELVLNALSALTNLSFYVKPRQIATPAGNSQSATINDVASTKDAPLIFNHPPRDVLSALLPLLFSSNTEVVSESCRALGNLSRDLHFRLLMQSSRGDEAILLLLEHADPSVVQGAAGVLLNMAAHVQGQDSLLANDAQPLQQAIDAMARFALPEAEEEDEGKGEGEGEGEQNGSQLRELSEPDWPVVSMFLKTFLNLRVVAPGQTIRPSTANPHSQTPTGAPLLLHRSIPLEMRMQLLHLLEAMMERMEEERTHMQPLETETSSDDDAADIHARLSSLSEAENLALQLMPACAMHEDE